MIWKMDSIAFIVTMFLLALYFFIYIGFKKRIYNCSYGMKEEKSNFFSRLQEQLEKIEFNEEGKCNYLDVLKKKNSKK